MRNLITHGLRKLVKSEQAYPAGDRHARIVSVATVKGGVGKTTTSVNLAAGLATFADAKVLLIDLDAQGHCSTSLSASLPKAGGRKTLSEVLLSDEKNEILDVAISSGVRRLDITPGDQALGEAEGVISQKIGKELLLRDALKVTRTHYDYIIIDCPPNKGNLTLNAMLASDHVLVPTDLSPLSVQGADELIGTVMTVNDRLGHELDLLGVVLTRVDGRNVTMNSTMLDQIQDAWGELILESQIGVNTQLSKAQLAGQPIFEYAPQSRGAEHYEALTREVMERLD